MSAENTLVEVRSRLSALIDFIDAPEAPSPPPPPPPHSAALVDFNVYQFFGPVQGAGALTQTPSSGFAFQGNALSASTKLFCFDLGLREVALARLFVVWAPGSAVNQLDLVHFDGGPSNVQQMVAVNGVDTSNPQTIDADVTSQLNALVTAKTRKHVGFRIKGNVAYTLYEVRLEVYWKIPGIVAQA